MTAQPDPLLLALACYRFPDADTGQERRMLRFDASRELRRLRAAAAQRDMPDQAPWRCP